jgi:hypothetical protein
MRQFTKLAGATLTLFEMDVERRYMPNRHSCVM